MLSLHEVGKQEGIKTGVILDITGAMANLYVQHMPGSKYSAPDDFDISKVQDVEPMFLTLKVR